MKNSENLQNITSNKKPKLQQKCTHPRPHALADCKLLIAP